MFTRLLYRMYRIFYVVQQWRTRRFTAGGTLLLIALVASAAIGLDTRKTDVYQIFTFLLSLLVIALVWSVFFRGRVTATRILPKFGTVKEPLEYRIIVRNRSQKTQKHLFLFENVEDPRPSCKSFC